MKSTKTILAVAIVIAGFAYAVGAGHPTFDVAHPRCCGPQPEDLRVYRVVAPDFQETIVIIPEVEGANGFILTDAFSLTPMKIYQDVGDGPVEILSANSNLNYRLSPVPGSPLILGSTITITAGAFQLVTIIGYVY